MNGDLKKLMKEMEKRGWRIEHGTNHYMCYSPTGIGHTTVSNTVKNPNIKMTRRQFERLM